MRKLKIAIYWLTAIGPIIDIITGAITGIKKGIQDIKTNAAKNEEQQALWERANRGE